MLLGTIVSDECDINNDPKCCFDIPVKKCDNHNIQKIEITEDGTHTEVRLDGTKQILEKTKINLHDCLSCGGCPNAEIPRILKPVELWEEFSDHLRKKTSEKTTITVVSLSPQSRSSLATHYGLSEETLLSKLTGVLRGLGVSHIFDVSFARELALLEGAREFIRRKRAGGVLPVLAGACPGWVGYAETTHGDYVLPYLSTTKSPQQIMGTLVKRHFSKKVNIAPSKIYHVTIMPCLDKRVEASRHQFHDQTDDFQDVDFVLTTKDTLRLIQEKARDFLHQELVDIDPLYTNIENGKLFGVGGGPSDGFLEYIFKTAAKELYGVNIKDIKYTTVGKTNDFKETTLEVNSEVVLRFAAAYGFRNIQPIVRQIKRQNCPYDYVEVMACPSGCTNGGGQIETEDGLKKSQQQVLEEVNNLYNSLPIVLPVSAQVQSVYKEWIKDDPEIINEFLHTNFMKAELIKEKPKSGCKCASSPIYAGKIW